MHTASATTTRCLGASARPSRSTRSACCAGRRGSPPGWRTSWAPIRSRPPAVWSPASTLASRSRTRPGRLLAMDLSLGRRPRARPPVVRRLGVGRPVAGHLAQRGLRDLHGAPLCRSARRQRPAVALHRELPRLPRDRVVLGPRHHRPGPAQHLRRSDLRPRRDDPRRPPQPDRQRGLPSAAARWVRSARAATRLGGVRGMAEKVSASISTTSSMRGCGRTSRPPNQAAYGL